MSPKLEHAFSGLRRIGRWETVVMAFERDGVGVLLNFRPFRYSCADSRPRRVATWRPGRGFEPPELPYFFDARG